MGRPFENPPGIDPKGRHGLESKAAMMYPSLDKNDKPTIRTVFPDEVVRPADAEELKELLQQYTQPRIDSMVKGDPAHRLHYIQRIRPALRYFCKKFGMPIPRALEGNGAWGGLPRESCLKTFGVPYLRVLEFPSKHLQEAKKGGK